MSYIQGFVIPVKGANKQAYLAMAEKASPLFAEYGATRTVECWNDDVMAGKRTDFRRAVKAADEEQIVFSWIEWPDRATCDKAAETMQADERMQPDGPMPFDAQRMIYAGFDNAYEAGAGGAIGYVDGMVASLPGGDRDAYVDFVKAMGARFLDRGATRVVDGWGADVPDGKVTDFRRAVDASEGETVVFGWVEWPDKATRDTGMKALMEDPAMQGSKPVWNGQLAIFGGFAPILDTDHR